MLNVDTQGVVADGRASIVEVAVKGGSSTCDEQSRGRGSLKLPHDYTDSSRRLDLSQFQDGFRPVTSGEDKLQIGISLAREA